MLNKGTAFTAEERAALGLTGLLPPYISTLEAQVRAAYIQYERLPDSLSKNIYLTALHDRNEVLFYRLFSEHLREMIPIVSDLTVGMAMEQYHQECRRPRGVYLSIDHAEGMEAALGNLGVRTEANPADLIAWTDGRGLIATGSSFSPVTYKGVTHVIAQVNNAVLYPGLALGVIVSRARRISTGMFAAAASAVSSLVTVRHPGASLLPQIDDLRSVSVTVAVAVAEAAKTEGLAGVKLGDIVRQVQDAMWQPEYRSIHAT